MTDQAERASRWPLPGTTGEPLTHDQLAQFGGLFDELDVGVVSVDPGSDFATVNEAAAALLDIDPGNTTATRFATVTRQLAERTLNSGDAAELLQSVETDPAAEFQSTWTFAGSPTHLGIVSKPAPYCGSNGRIWAFYDNSVIAAALDTADEASALIRASSDATLDPQVLLEAVWQDGRVVDLVNRAVNRAACEYFGFPQEKIVGRQVFHSELLEQYARCAETGEPVILDAVPHQSEVFGDLRYYDIRATQVRTGTIILTWRDVTDRIEVAQRIAASEQQFRLLAENMGDVVILVDDDGTVTWISNSIEQVLGDTADHWLGGRVYDFIPAADREAGISRWNAIADAGTYIGRVTVFSADGTRHTAHLHSKPFFNADGHRNGFVASFRVIDVEVAAEAAARKQLAARDERNRVLAQDLQEQASRLTSQLNSAARYVRSILPADLDGSVAVTARYLPSAELSGDSYDFRWVDGDHLIAYLVDVSGHGVEPALLSVSVHNVLRSGSVDRATLLQPGSVLTHLNRLFHMDRQGGLCFTIWYGVDQPATRTLSYARAGHPPAIVLTADGPDPVLLSSGSVPIGVLADTTYETEHYRLNPGDDLLIYSDGAFEVVLPGGEHWNLEDFIDLCASTARAPHWTLDDLVAQLRRRSGTGTFDDDCTLVRVTVP